MSTIPSLAAALDRATTEVSGDETAPREALEFQRKLSVLAEDALFCLNAARERFAGEMLYERLIPVVEAALYDASEVAEEMMFDLAQLDEPLLLEFKVPARFLKLQTTIQISLDNLTLLHTGSSRESILAAACTASGELLRAVVGLENALADTHGAPRSLSLAQQLEQGLALRNLIVRFDRALRGLEGRDDRLVLAQKLVANLNDSKPWRHARPLDQLRMQSVLVSEEWEELVAFAAELRQVENRAEIRSYDAAQLQAALEQVLEQPAEESIAEESLLQLESIRCVSEDLDGLFRRGTAATVGEWKYHLERGVDLLEETSQLVDEPTNPEVC